MSEPAPAWLPVAIVGGFAVVFPLFWMGIVSMLGRFGGWARLAGVFPLPPGTPDPPGWFAWTSGRLGWTSYRSVLRVGPSEQGLHLWTVRFFRTGHPRVLVPWDQLEVEAPENWVLVTRTSVTFSGKGLPALQLYGDAGRAVYDTWKKSRGEEA